MILWRVLPWQPRAKPSEPGGALWFPRELQGRGRHDNPDLYGCMYVSESPISPIAESLAPFRGTGELQDAQLLRAGRRLALVQLTLDDALPRLIDLDDPQTLLGARLRPSEVASRDRASTQLQASQLYETRGDALGLRWWSTLESQMINLTLFDRAAKSLSFEHAKPLATDDIDVRAAAELLGLAGPASR